MLINTKHSLEEIIKLLPFIKSGADSNKEALGFIPEGAYDDFAISGKIIAATVTINGEENYAGHLVFGGVYPHAKVFQLFVDQRWRGAGIARRLINHLKDRLTNNHWLSISANVRDNLASNSVWAHMGFRIVATKEGGVARGRRINVRVLDLDVPSLFSLMERTDHQDGLRFAERYSSRPIYVIDLNVLFDAIRNRAKSPSAHKVIGAALRNSIRLMVTAEFTEELTRTSSDTSNDPVLAFAKHLEFLSRPPQKILSALVDKIAPEVFPHRATHGTLTNQDKSDLVHIATAIHHRVAGFITSEKAILRASGYLQDAYKFDVIGLEEFAQFVDIGDRVLRISATDVVSGTLHSRHNDEGDLAKAHDFLEMMRTPPAFIEEAMACQGTQAHWQLIVDEAVPVGYAKWGVHGGVRRTADIYVCVDEQHSAADAIVDHLLDAIPRDLSQIAPTLVRLHIPPGHVVSRKAALSKAFSPPEGALNRATNLQRLAVGRVVLADNWGGVRKSIISAAGISLPLDMPAFVPMNPSIFIEMEPRGIEMPLADIERALAPVLFLFSGRDGVIVPIKEHFARDLFGASPQPSLFASLEATFRQERVFINTPRTRQLMKPGTPILFYESKGGHGRGAVIALVRTTGSRVVSKGDALNIVQQRGVLNEKTLEEIVKSKNVLETTFDNTFMFKNPVKLSKLREIGCVDGYNIVTARHICSNNLQAAVKEGLFNE